MQSLSPDMSFVTPSASRPARESILARLRQETRAEHEAIEHNPRMARLMANDLQSGEYVALLLRLAEFYAPLERGLRTWADRLPKSIDVSARLVKTAMLRRDIEALSPGFSFDADDEGDAVHRFATREQVWGWLYVIEGSTLGGQVISRRLAATLGVTPERGAGFHNPYGARTGARWQTFKAGLEEDAAEGSLDEDAVVAAARAAFAAMDAWMAAGQ
jgi:heme oxygenase